MHFFDCHILLVDDEKDILEINERLLRKKGFCNIDRAMNGSVANEKVNLENYHLAVLDIMLPDTDGFKLYEKWLKLGKNFPVIFLSAKDEENSRLKGLGLGADDYITKPYTPEELYLRIRAVLKRTYRINESDMVIMGETKVDLSAGIVYKGDNCYELTAKEFLLFSKLYENKDKIVSINALMDTLWPDGSYGLENSLIVHIRRLREKIEASPSKPMHLQTVRGLGYRLMGVDNI